MNSGASINQKKMNVIAPFLAAITFPPLASKQIKRAAAASSLALLKAKDNPIADGNS